MTHRLMIALTLCCCAACAVAQTAAIQQPDGAALEAPPIAVRPDERRAERPITFDLFGRPTELGVSYEVTFERRRNFDFDSAAQRDRRTIEQELKVDAQHRASDSVTLFAQLKALGERRKELRDGSVRHEQSLERGQTWVLVNDLAGLPLSLQAGRIALIEPRSWWWDDDLDAARFRFDAGDWRLETGLARELARESSALPGIAPDAKGVTRWFGNGGYRWARRHSVEAFWLTSNDASAVPAPGSVFAEDAEDASDANLRWFGVRASGEWRHDSGHRLRYNADAAIVRGRETRTPFTDTPDGQLSAGASTEHRVRGHAWDLGAHWTLPGNWRPSLSLGLAGGSGGSDSDALDRNFRQTGLQENKGRIAGVKRVRYYGELLDPELSNLRVATVGLGVRFLPNSSAEVVLHRYRQQVASTRLAGARPSEDPQGTNRDIGREVDVLVSMREWRHVELLLKLSKFYPGAAYAVDRRDPATGAEIVLTLTF